MYRYLLWRLAPFYVIALICEFLSFGILLAVEQSVVDWSFLAMIKTIGVLLKTTTIAFLYIMLPYMTYLCMLPNKYINSKFDKNLTMIVFAAFVFYTFFEETMSLVYWNNFSAAFNSEVVEYVLDLNEVIASLSNNYIFFAYILALFALTHWVVIKSKCFLWQKSLNFSLAKRIIYWLIYFASCLLIFFNCNDDELKIDENQINNELSKDGTYSLGRSFWNNKTDIYKVYILKKSN
ncbi:MAG: hypothetical protein IJV97_03005 [Alphaproteobacteria bacterium]|nr:hypothetical protein [Alphaproteobacteria bacterium]